MKLLASVIFSVSVIFALAEQATAHSGRTNSSGCHAGSRPYHCHGGGSSRGGSSTGVGSGGSSRGGSSTDVGSGGSSTDVGSDSSSTGGSGSTGGHGGQENRCDDAFIAIVVLGGIAVTLWGIYVIASFSKDNMSALDEINNDTYLSEAMLKEKFYLSSVVGKNWGLGLTVRL